MNKTLSERSPARRGPVRRTDEQRTRVRILKAAERLFAQRGFNRVSVRDLAAAARVNVALIGYHFRSKQGLLAEVYRRHCGPMNEERLRGLQAAMRLPAAARVPAIVEAFIRPALRHVEVEEGETFIRLRAVLSGENSELLEKLVSENFDQLGSAFIAALCDCLPHLSQDDVCWRFHFMLGTLYYTAAGPHRIHAVSKGRCDPSQIEEVMRELVPFLTSGFLAPAVERGTGVRGRKSIWTPVAG